MSTATTCSPISVRPIPTGYTITETQPAGHLDGIDTAGSLGGDATAVTDDISDIVVDPADSGTDYVFAEVPAASLAGAVFADKDNDGVFDVGEVGIAAVVISLTGTDDLGNVVSLTTTPQQTARTASRICARARTRSKRPRKLGFSTASTASGRLAAVLGQDQVADIAVAPGDVGTGYDFGELPPSVFRGFVYNDTNNDGVFDAGEFGIEGVTVTLTGTNDLGDLLLVTTTTLADGSYAFSDLRPSDAGGYTIAETQPATVIDGIDTVGSLGGVASPNDTFSAIPVGVEEIGQQLQLRRAGRCASSPASFTTTPTTTEYSTPASQESQASPSR